MSKAIATNITNINEKMALSEALLLSCQCVRKLDTKIVDKYVISLENALKPNLLPFRNMTTIPNPEYDVVDDHCAEILDFPAVISKLRASTNLKGWDAFCDHYANLLRYCDAILDMLGRNGGLPLGNNVSSGDRKSRFSTILIYCLILNEIPDIRDEDVTNVKNSLKELFDLIIIVITMGWDSKGKNTIRLDPDIRSVLEYYLNQLYQSISKARSYLYNINNKGIISSKQYRTVLCLIRLAEHIPWIFNVYINLLNSCFATKDKNFIMKNFKDYIEAIISVTTHLFILAIQPERFREFFAAIRPSIDEMKEITRCTLNHEDNSFLIYSAELNQSQKSSNEKYWTVGIRMLAILLIIGIIYTFINDW